MGLFHALRRPGEVLGEEGAVGRLLHRRNDGVCKIRGGPTATNVRCGVLPARVDLLDGLLDCGPVEALGFPGGRGPPDHDVVNSAHHGGFALVLVAEEPWTGRSAHTVVAPIFWRDSHALLVDGNQYVAGPQGGVGGGGTDEGAVCGPGFATGVIGVGGVTGTVDGCTGKG